MRVVWATISSKLVSAISSIFDLRSWLADKGSLPKESRYATDIRKDLECQAYEHTDKGKLKLIPKSKMSQSPDISDAIALTFAGPVTAMGHEFWKDPYEKTNTTYVR